MLDEKPSYLVPLGNAYWASLSLSAKITAMSIARRPERFLANPYPLPT